MDDCSCCRLGLHVNAHIDSRLADPVSGSASSGSSAPGFFVVEVLSSVTCRVSFRT